jgi:protein SCO1/2
LGLSRPGPSGPSVGPNRGGRQRLAWLTLLAALLVPLPGVAAQDAAPSADVRLVDASLLDQDGHALRFATEAVGEHIVAINFVYTGCTTLCPLTSATFHKVQGLLKSKPNEDIRLISLSLDPATDTPDRLKDYAARHHAGPGWLWLTGQRADVEAVLKGLGAYTPEFRDHPPQVLVGDGRSGQWTRFNSLPAPDRIRTELERYRASRRHD